MNGPVSNGHAQLEDALLELGLDSAILVAALVRWLDEVERMLENDRPGTGAFWDHATMRQRLWDHVAQLDPVRRGAFLLDDLHKATLEHIRREHPETFTQP